MVKVMIIRRGERERDEEGRDDNENNCGEVGGGGVGGGEAHPFLQDRHHHCGCRKKKRSKKSIIPVIKTNVGGDHIHNGNTNSSTVNLDDLCGLFIS